jgi:hypothetical protein
VLVTRLILTKTLSFHRILNVGLHLEWSFQFWHHLYLKFRFVFKAAQHFTLLAKVWSAAQLHHKNDATTCQKQICPNKRPIDNLIEYYKALSLSRVADNHTTANHCLHLNSPT